MSNNKICQRGQTIIVIVIVIIIVIVIMITIVIVIVITIVIVIVILIVIVIVITIVIVIAIVVIVTGSAEVPDHGGLRKGTNGVSTNGVTAFLYFSFLTEGPFGYPR